MEGELELLPDQPLGHKLIKKWFRLYLFVYLAAPAGYLIKVIISNSLSVAEVGILYSIVSLIGLLNVYNDLWLTESLQYFLPRYRIKKQYDYAKTAIYLSLFVQVFTAAIIVVFIRLWAPRIAQHYLHSPGAETILKYFCFYFLGINILQTMQSVFIAFQDTFSYQLTELIRNRAILWFTFFFFITGAGNIANYSLNRILWLLVGIMIGGFIFFRKYRKQVLKGKIIIEKPMLREYTKYALRCFLWLNVANLFWQVIQQITIVMMGPESAWYYTNFLSLFGIAGVVIWPIMGLIFPIVSELVSKKDDKKLSLLFNFFYTYFSVLSFSIAILFFVLWKEVALIVFWKKFVISWMLLMISSIFVVFNNLLVFNLSVLAGMGKIRERVKMLLISTVLAVTTTICCIPRIGIYGAIIGFCIGQTSLFALSYLKLKKQISIPIDRWFVIRNMVFMSFLWAVIRYIKWKIFIFNDIMRYDNLRKWIALVAAFFLLIGIMNRKKAIALKNEIKKIRK